MQTWEDVIANSQIKYGFSCSTIGTSERIELNQDIQVETSCTIKILIMLCLFDRMKKGDLSFETSILISNNDVDDKGSGVIKWFHLPESIKLYNAMVLMMSVSDNVAANACIRLLGKDTINTYAQTIGLTKTKLIMPKISFNAEYDMVLSPVGHSTPAEMSTMLSMLVEGKLFDAAYTNQALTLLGSVQNSRIMRMLQSNECKDEIKKYGGKTGTCGSESLITIGECGYLRTQNGATHIISLYSRANYSDNDHFRLDSAIVIEFSQLAKLLYEELR